jgi:hypothetical protein
MNMVAYIFGAVWTNIPEFRRRGALLASAKRSHAGSNDTHPSYSLVSLVPISRFGI